MSKSAATPWLILGAAVALPAAGIGLVIWWFKKQYEAQELKSANDVLATLQAPNKSLFEQTLFELPSVSGHTVESGPARVMKLRPLVHWFTERFQPGQGPPAMLADNALVFSADNDLNLIGVLPVGSIVAYLGLTTNAGCDPKSGEGCVFHRSYISGLQADKTLIVGWVESGDLVEVDFAKQTGKTG